MTKAVLVVVCNSVTLPFRQKVAKHETMTFDKFVIIDDFRHVRDICKPDLSKDPTLHCSDNCSVSNKTSKQDWTTISSTQELQRCHQQKMSKILISSQVGMKAGRSSASKPSPCVHKKRRKAANARERSRMSKINTAFNELRQKVPSYSDSVRLSKYDTLLMAQQYICALQDLLKQETGEKDDDKHKLQTKEVPNCTGV